MINIIPLQSIPYQNFNIVLNNQGCTFNVYQRGGFIYVDLYINNQPIFLGIKAIDGQVLNPFNSTFIGYLIFASADGSDPQYQNFSNGQTILVYTDNGQV